MSTSPKWVLLPQLEKGNEYTQRETLIGGQIRIIMIPEAIPPWWRQHWEQLWQIAVALLGGGAVARWRDLINPLLNRRSRC